MVAYGNRRKWGKISLKTGKTHFEHPLQQFPIAIMPLSFSFFRYLNYKLNKHNMHNYDYLLILHYLFMFLDSVFYGSKELLFYLLPRVEQVLCEQQLL